VINQGKARVRPEYSLGPRGRQPPSGGDPAVEGLTERQLRRIEQGECRATSAAIVALANAHGLDANAYMERLTKAMQ